MDKTETPFTPIKEKIDLGVQDRVLRKCVASSANISFYVGNSYHAKISFQVF